MREPFESTEYISARSISYLQRSPYHRQLLLLDCDLLAALQMALSDNDHKSSLEQKDTHVQSVVSEQEVPSDEEFLATLGYKQEVKFIFHIPKLYTHVTISLDTVQATVHEI